jgi:hypothetical protein
MKKSSSTYPTKSNQEYSMFKINVIEDDDGLNLLIRKKLQKEGYKTDGAFTGQEALAKMSGDKNEILLIDFKLPDMTGMELIEKVVRKFNKQPHFIIMTGFGDENIAVEMMKLGAKDYIIKEANFIDLLPEKLKQICQVIQKTRKLEEAENELRIKTQLINETGQMARVGGWEIDLETNTVVWSDVTKEIHETPSEYVPNIEEATSFYTAEAKLIVEKALEQAIKNGNIFNLELPMITAKGREIWVHALGKPEMKAGKCIRLHGTFQDITERKKAEEELKAINQQLKASELRQKEAREKAEENEEKFKLLNRLISEMLLLPDMASIYKFIGENLQKHHPNTLVLIVSIDELNQQSRLEVATGLDNSLLAKAIKISGFNPVGRMYKLTTIHNNYFKSGNLIEFTGGLAEFSAGEFPALAASAIESLIGLHKIYTIGINKDDELIAAIHFFTFNKQVITDANFIEIFVKQVGLVLQKKIDEKALIKAKEKAEESDRLKSAFLANMSHEIRTPMNGILGFTTLLQQPNLTGEEQHEYIEIIQKSGDRMLNTVNDIIDISRIEAGQVELSLSDVNINEQLKFLHSFFKPEAEKNGTHLLFKNNTAEHDFSIKTDREKFNSILTNLIKNAIKFTSQGLIELGYHIKKDIGSSKVVEFYVKDTGIGIPKDKQKAIFERFIQADIEDKRAFQGSGLGLAISKAYAEMMGGKIWVESKPEQGSVFYFTIPYVDELEREVDLNDFVTADGNTDNFKKLNIVIAEDDITSEMFLKIIVKPIAEKVLVARTGTETVEVCRNNPDIDLILMDIQMPGINGYEATRQIREFNKDVIIIAQTAFALDGDSEKALVAGCNDHITKPINKDALFTKIKNLLNTEP